MKPAGAASADAAADATADAVRLDEQRLDILVDQGASVRWQVVAVVLIIAAMVWHAVPSGWVLAWAATAIGVREWRSLALTRMLARRELPIAMRKRRAVQWNALIGAVNGSAALFMLWTDTTHDALLSLVLVGWGAGGVATGATLLPAFIAYGGMLYGAVAVSWLLHGNWLGVGVALLTLMQFGLQTRYARRAGESFVESYRMRQENLALAQRLAEARDAAESANRAKSRFLAAASHDLRQPLQALALNSGELTRCADLDTLNALAPDIHRGVEDLRAMLDGLLELSSLDGDTILAQPRRVDLDTLLPGVLAGFQAAAAAKGLALHCRCEPNLQAMADPSLLRRLLSNLLDNAIKFTAVGEVCLSAAAVEQGVELRISDTGIGIDAAAQELVFEETVQLHNPDRDRTKGYGLGLSIVRRLADLLDARLSLHSEAGVGSTFMLRLPAASAAAVAKAAPEPAAASATTPSRGCRVLVLDDDAAVRGAFERALAGWGCEVAVAATIAEAEALLPAARSQVALVDYRLRAGDDGLEAIQRLRRLHPPLVALLCTADASPQIRDGAHAAGVPILRKPIDEQALARAVHQAMRDAPPLPV